MIKVIIVIHMQYMIMNWITPVSNIQLAKIKLTRGEGGGYLTEDELGDQLANSAYEDTNGQCSIRNYFNATNRTDILLLDTIRISP